MSMDGKEIQRIGGGLAVLWLAWAVFNLILACVVIVAVFCFFYALNIDDFRKKSHKVLAGLAGGVLLLWWATEGPQVDKDTADRFVRAWVMDDHDGMNKQAHWGLSTGPAEHPGQRRGLGPYPTKRVPLVARFDYRYEGRGKCAGALWDNDEELACRWYSWGVERNDGQRSRLHVAIPTISWWNEGNVRGGTIGNGIVDGKVLICRFDDPAWNEAARGP